MSTTIVYTGCQANASIAASTSSSSQFLTVPAVLSEKVLAASTGIPHVLPVNYESWYHIMPTTFIMLGTALALLVGERAVNYIIAYLRRFGSAAPCTDGGE